jgi:glycosyltransferase involved in cell wall biosynthesis
MVDVIKRLKIIKQNISAIIIGDGSFLDGLKKLIKENDIESNIVVTGFLGNERYKLLQQSSIFVSPTYAKEGFGLTLLEALFFGVPVIAYTNPVLEEVFGHYESVRLISQDIKLLQDSILESLQEKKPYHLSDLDVYSLENCVIREKDIL